MGSTSTDSHALAFNPYVKPKTRIAATVVALALVGLSPYADWPPLEFKPTEAGFALGVLGKLFVVALFVERALEFLIELYRGAGREKLDYELEAVRTECEQPGSANRDCEQRLLKLRIRGAQYKAVTVRVSLWVAFLFGLALGLVGIRCLSPFMSLESLSANQKACFHALDILLTGSVVSGGSEGIHRLMRVYNRLMDDTADRVKQRGQSRTNNPTEANVGSREQP